MSFEEYQNLQMEVSLAKGDCVVTDSPPKRAEVLVAEEYRQAVEQQIDLREEELWDDLELRLNLITQ